MSLRYFYNQTVELDDYLEFLTRTDLGHEFPLDDFLPRITLHLRHCTFNVTARDANDNLIGLLMGWSDHAYYAFITDLGVARSHARQGIGTRLLEEARPAIGSPYPIICYLDSADNAVTFYQRLGWYNADTLFADYQGNWNVFSLTPEKLAALRARGE